MKQFIKKFLIKLTGRKAIVVLWTLFIITVIVFKNDPAFLPLAEILCAIPLSYLGINAFVKKIDKDSNNNNNNKIIKK